jgi:limonene-1,2-epoxide hydrolase
MHVGVTSFRGEIVSTGAAEDRVYVERMDIFDINGHHGEIPIVGVFVLRDGLIAEWREFYDRQSFAAVMQ